MFYYSFCLLVFVVDINQNAGEETGVISGVKYAAIRRGTMRVEISGWPEEVKRPYTDKVHTFGLPNLKAIWAAKDNIKFKGKNV